MAKQRRGRLPDDPLWFKDAVIYELHVRAFCDGDGDGIGDFAGLARKLDYLEHLGINAIWLLPFYPSPLRDDGYDTSDYFSVHESYGTLKDFETFLREAHRRGIRVITELVVNHTSDQHAWFQRARRAKPGSRARDFYVWSNTPDKFSETRIIFEDFEHSNWAYDPLAKAYYWHRFYSHQPDLNYDNPDVQKAVLRVLDFWMEMGVDGMRLDAIPYLYERDGTDCENLPETHEFLRQLRRHVDAKHPNRVLLAEANQWPEDAAAYFGNGDECHMNFHFPLMPRLFMAIQMEDRFPVIDILGQTPPIPNNAQWALFLRNHDELTLEMVTDEERDYMYRVYALDRQARINLGIRRRLAPLLGNNRRAMELMNALLLSLPGTPVIYYGDELGMGDNVYLGDRNGVRTPMQWSSDRNAGFSSANPQSLYLPVIIDPEYHYETVNVEAHLANPNSLLWWMKRAIALRKRFKAFGRGTMEFLEPDNRKVLAYVRRYEDEAILVVNNLSRFAQYVKLDLSRFADRRMVELFGRTRFPTIGPEPYMLSLGPHSFLWFALEAPVQETVATRAIPSVTAEGDWTDVVTGDARGDLERALPAYLVAQRWFGGKDAEITEASLRDAVAVPYGRGEAYLSLIDVAYTERAAETYLLPLGFATDAGAERLLAESPQAVVASVSVERPEAHEDGLLFDASYDPAFGEQLVALIERRRTLRGRRGTLRGSRTRLFRKLRPDGDGNGQVRISGAEQSNTSIVFGDRMILKLYRRLHEGTHPDLEIGRFLSERRRFENTPAVGGAIDYGSGKRAPITLGFLQEFVRNEGDAWTYALDLSERYIEESALRGPAEEQPAADAAARAAASVGPFLESARLLGKRTAGMHAALAADRETPDFKPERFSKLARRSLYQSVRNQIVSAMRALRRAGDDLAVPLRAQAREILALEDEMLRGVATLLRPEIQSCRIRTHGDYHLGQVLHTGRDFVIIDFEGEPSRSIGERRLKRSPLRDVAGMLRSFHYVAATALQRVIARTGAGEEEREKLVGAARAWRSAISVGFVQSYLEAARGSAFLGEASDEEINALLRVFQLEKATYELGYELANRPGWAWIPLEGILQTWRNV